MKRLDRDNRILEHIVSYCLQIDETIQRLEDSAEVFQADVIYRNAVAMSLEPSIG